MTALSAHFDSAEFACHDCGKVVVSAALIAALEQLRTLAGAPILVDDGYRCPEHNASVGGVSASQHMLGQAADIRIEGKALQEMWDMAQQVSAFLNGGIGVYDSDPPFIHVDVRGQMARWARVRGVYVSVAESRLVTT